MTAPEDNADEDFPELVELRASQRARHRKLVAWILGGSSLLALAGALLLVVGGGRSAGLRLGGIMLLGAGAIGLVRGLWSALTDIDTKPREDFLTGAEPGSPPGADDTEAPS